MQRRQPAAPAGPGRRAAVPRCRGPPEPGALLNLAAAIAVGSAAMALTVAGVAWRIGRAPGWSDMRWLSLVALGASAYALGNVATTSGQADAVVVAFSHVQLAGVFLELWAWFHLGDRLIGPATRRAVVVLRRAVLAAAGLALVPGLPFGGEVRGHAFAAWGTTYRDAVPTPLGSALFAFAVASAAAVVVRFILAWRRGVPFAALHVLALGAILVLGANDALAGAGLIDTPYLLDLGFALPVVALTWSQAERFVAEARLLRQLQRPLEALVGARTEELVRTQQALHRAEKLAALGQFAAGVAHQVNNPAAVVNAALGYLERQLGDGSLPDEAAQSLAEAREAMRRIVTLVRQLVDAGRRASLARPTGSTSLARAAEAALSDARAEAPPGTSLEARVPEGLAVRGTFETVHQVLAQLLLNAVASFPEGRAGRVGLEASAEAGTVRVVVTDDGAGMAPEVLQRVFDPFFTTRGAGQGAGLGLTVARALAEGMGGSLRLESEPGRGTRAELILVEAPPPSPAATPAPGALAAP